MMKKYLLAVFFSFCLASGFSAHAQVIGEDDSVDMTKPAEDDAGIASLKDGLPGEVAQALIYKNDGTKVGFATFKKAPQGVLISVNAAKLPSGWHGVHLHDIPECTPDYFLPFKTAGNHIGSQDVPHGYMKGPHNGDLPNMWIGANGTGRAEFYTEAVNFDELVRNKGHSIVIDAQPDSHIAPSSGDTDVHIACGIVRREIAAKQ